MPTAVERLLDSFLNFDTSSEQRKLDQAFVKIDEAFATLSDFNGDGVNFLEVEHQQKGSFNVVGNAFIKLGADFQQVATAERLTDKFVVKLLDDHKPGELLPAVQTAFKELELKIRDTSTDLKLMGVDFIRLDSSPNAETFDHKTAVLAGDFVKVGADMLADRDAFIKLGNDFLELATKAGEDPKSSLDDAYKEFGGELLSIGQTFDTLSADFAKIGEALTGPGSGPNEEESTIGRTLSLVFEQLHFLDAQFAKMGDGSVRLINALSSAAPSEGGGGEPPPVILVDTNHGGGHGHG